VTDARPQASDDEVARNDVATSLAPDRTPGAAKPGGAAPTAVESRRLPATFWRLFSASFLSNLGDGLSLIAFPWLATTITTEPLAVAAVGIFSRLPWLLFSLPAGALIDRSDRKRVMVLTNTVRFVMLAVVAGAVWLDVMNLPLLYVAMLVLGCAEVMFDSATIVIVPSIVGGSRLDRANGLISGGQGVANDFLGAPLAGVLISVALVLPFAGHALLAGVSAVLIAMIAGSYRAAAAAPVGPPVAGDAPAAPRTPLRVEVAAGIRWLWRHGLLWHVAVATAVINATTWPILATFVLFGQEILGTGARSYGLIMAAGGLGMLAGSQVVPWFTKHLGRGRTLALTVAVPGVLFLIGAATSNVWVAGAVVAVWGALVAMWNVVTVSLRQILVPDEMLGRVGSVYRFLGIGASSIGIILVSGLMSVVTAMADREAGLRTPFIVAGIAHLLLLVPAFLRFNNTQVERSVAAAGTGDA
jgi:MFS family permease